MLYIDWFFKQENKEETELFVLQQQSEIVNLKKGLKNLSCKYENSIAHSQYLESVLHKRNKEIVKLQGMCVDLTLKLKQYYK